MSRDLDQLDYPYAFYKHNVITREVEFLYPNEGFAGYIDYELYVFPEDDFSPLALIHTQPFISFNPEYRSDYKKLIRRKRDFSNPLIAFSRKR